MRSLLAFGSICVVVVAWAAQPSAGQQATVNFSGAWSAVKDAPTGIAAAPSAVFGAKFWLRHDGETFTVVRPLRDTAVIGTHKLDGTEQRSPIPGAMCLGDATIITTAQWDGTAIVHTTVSQIAPGSSTPTSRGLRHILRMVAPDTLVVESTMRTAPAPAELTAVATVYKKTTDPEPVPSTPKAKGAPATLANVQWIGGTWIATTKTGSVEERWTAAEGGAMLATSRTVGGGAVTAFEFLCIAERAGGLVYTAMPNGRSPATDFTLTAVDESSATFENPTHDFPKLIRYARQPDGALHATISDGAKRQAVFVFKKQ